MTVPPVHDRITLKVGHVPSNMTFDAA